MKAPVIAGTGRGLVKRVTEAGRALTVMLDPHKLSLRDPMGVERHAAVHI